MAKNILILSTDYGVEKPEIVQPLETLRADGHTVTVATPGGGDVQTVTDDRNPDVTVPTDTALADVTQLRCFDISYVYTGNTAGDSPDESVASPDITIVGESNVAANRVRNFATQLCDTVDLPVLPRDPQTLVPNQTYNQTFVSFSVDDAGQPGVEATGLRMETPPGTVMTWRHNL